MASATDPLVEWKEMMLVLQESTLARLFMGESAGVAVAVGEEKLTQQNKLRTQILKDGENESSLTLAGFRSRESSKSIAERIMRITSPHTRYTRVEAV